MKACGAPTGNRRRDACASAYAGRENSEGWPVAVCDARPSASLVS